MYSNGVGLVIHHTNIGNMAVMYGKDVVLASSAYFYMYVLGIGDFELAAQSMFQDMDGIVESIAHDCYVDYDNNEDFDIINHRAAMVIEELFNTVDGNIFDMYDIDLNDYGEFKADLFSSESIILFAK